MDPILIGTILGGLLTLSGNLLANYLNIRKEREQWERQQRAEQQKLAREEQKLARSQLFEIYNNSIRHLSMFIVEPYSESSEEDAPMSENKKTYYLEAQRWLWLLSLNLGNVDTPDLKTFEEELKNFFEGSYSADTEVLRDLVVKFAKHDPRLKEGMALIKYDGAT